MNYENMLNAGPFILTFQLATVTLAILLLVGLPIAYWLGRTRCRYAWVMEALVSLPIILPPSVLGFYLLLAFSPESGMGAFLEDWFGIRLAFTFEGLVIASVIYSLPFMVQPIRSAFRELPASLSEAARTMGASGWKTFFRVELPNIKHALLSGVVLSFAHTVGEFGVVLMIGGNIPGETRVASVEVFNQVEALRYGVANQYALVLLLISFVVLGALHYLNRKKGNPGISGLSGN